MKEYRWTDLAPGLTERFDACVTREAMEQFAELSGDRNPLHMDDGFARSSGFRERVAYGMLTSSFYSTLVGMYLPGRWAILHGLDVEMKAPAFVGDRLTVCGVVTHLSEAVRRVEIKGSIVNAEGTVISKAKIRAGVHER